MKKCVICLLLVLCMVLAGCGEVAGEIAGNVAEAAKKELENQIRQTFETYKIDIVEMKTAVGSLNGDGEDIQFFCAVLVRSDSDAIPRSAADTLRKLFHDAGVVAQDSDGVVDSDYLEHKSITYKFSSFDDGQTYYTVWFYTDKLPSLSDLESIAKDITIPAN